MTNKLPREKYRYKGVYKALKAHKKDQKEFGQKQVGKEKKTQEELASAVDNIGEVSSEGSIWKPVSELPKDLEGQILIQMKDGQSGYAYYDSVCGKFIVSQYQRELPKLMEVTVVKENITNFCTLSDFIKDFEKLKERVKKLEQK